MQEPQIIQGRAVTAEDVAAVHRLMSEHPDWHRTRLSRELCAQWGWVDDTGRIKDMACRTLLLKLERRGLIALPRRRGPSVNHRRGRVFQPVLHDTTPIHGAIQDLLPVHLIPADSGPTQQLWQALLHGYHYLRFTP